MNKLLVEENNVRIEKLYYLKGMLGDAYNTSLALRELLSEYSDEWRLMLMFPDISERIAELEDPSEALEYFRTWAVNNNKLGFIAEIVKPYAKGRVTYWNCTEVTWIYADTIEELMLKAAEWGKE